MEQPARQVLHSNGGASHNAVEPAAFSLQEK